MFENMCASNLILLLYLRILRMLQHLLRDAEWNRCGRLCRIWKSMDLFKTILYGCCCWSIVSKKLYWEGKKPDKIHISPLSTPRISRLLNGPDSLSFRKYFLFPKPKARRTYNINFIVQYTCRSKVHKCLYR